MKFKIVLRYPSGYRYITESEYKGLAEAHVASMKLARKKDEHFRPKWMKDDEGYGIVKIESVTEVKPLTWNDAINAMSAEEKAKAILWIIAETCEDGLATEEELTELLKMPYDGRAQEGAEYED